MEKKTKQRILGILAIIGLVIILLPLFQSTKEVPLEVALVKPPPFPDQAVQVTVNTTPENEVIPIAPAELQAQIAQQNNSALEPQNVPAPQPEPVKVEEKVVVTQEKIKTPIAKKPVAKHTPAVKENKKIQVSEKKYTRYQPIHIDNDGLIKFKNAVWVIHIGSFKNKERALRLVNQLRTNGYRAFIQRIATTQGDDTRVFVGPENRQASARALATRLESDMHIRGIVISYKPLTL